MSLGTRGEQGNAAPSSRADAVAAVVLQVMDRRSRGEALTDAAVISAHRELLPELEAELAALRRVHHARLAAMKAGVILEPSGPLQGERGAEDFANSSFDQTLERHTSGNPVGQQTAIRGYSITAEINSGGQGTVFKATQEATGRVVAIKVIPGGLLISSRHRARFEREVGILAALDHPNIVGVLDSGRTADGSLFMVMDFIDGGPLDEYVERCRAEDPGNVQRLVRLFADIAHAVHEAHARGIVHRDLKPSNIRIDKRGQPHILDFGLARLATGAPDSDLQIRSVTVSGQIVGSLPWASPEQVSGHSDDLDVRSDVYSLGVMLYQALTGDFPYSVTEVMPELVRNILQAVPAPPSKAKHSRKGKINAALDAIVLKALAKAPADRYVTAGKLGDALEDYLAGRPVAGVEWRCPKWLRVAMVGGGVMGMLGVGATAWWQYRNQPTVVIPAALPSYVNDVEMRFVRLSPSGFMMGSLVSERGHDSDEEQQFVTIERPYYMGVTEVTQQQYEAVMGTLPCKQEWAGEDLPVQGVLWTEAVEFCKRLSQREGKVYRLPSEKEWEYACRGGMISPYAGTGELDSMGWYRGNSGGRVHPVARKSPNHFGLYDMHGNVREWCQDPYTAVPGGVSRISPERAAKIRDHILRGGGATRTAEECRSAQRGTPIGMDSRVMDMGFRVVLDGDDLLEQ
ncbi:MAG: bifunctional serine/threonine-protein kinase/formylglycine-generating enzyme family protein [Bacillota bacterium]